MIYLYTGTPGSGKSYHATSKIYYKLHYKKKKYVGRVISNYWLDIDDDRFLYLDNSEITVDKLIQFALKNHKVGIEGQTLLVIDEAQIIFNSRTWNTGTGKGISANDRMQWIKFFSQHRKFGFDIILVCQNDRMLDRQIRVMTEYEVAHMKINNYFRILPLTFFLAVTRWYGQKMKLDHNTILFRKKIARLYDSYKFFENEYKIDAGEEEKGSCCDMGNGVPIGATGSLTD